MVPLWLIAVNNEEGVLGGGRSRGLAHALQNWPRIVIHANGPDPPVDHVKAVDHRDDAERSIEIKDGGTPLAIDYMPLDVDALDRREKSGENRANCWFPFD